MSSGRALGLIVTMTALTGSTGASAGETARVPADLNGWKLLAPLPDRVGFAGMVAGVLDGKLVAAGGSNFPEKPVWLKGEKAYSDRVYVLTEPSARWAEHATRLPAPVANPASAAADGVVYYAGGFDAKGGVHAAAWAMRARGDALSFTRLPDLPAPVGYGVGALVGRRFFVAGGLDAAASKTPSTAVWSLPVDALGEGWRREAELPAPGVFVSAAATDGTALYVFGGIGFDSAGKPVPSKAAHRLKPAASAWERLPDLPEARVGAATPAPLVVGNRFFLIGGYAEVFPGAPREHPGFSAQTLYYDFKDDRWVKGPMLPRAAVVDRDAPSDAGPAPMIAAPCVVWRNHVVVVSGEVRAAVRTPAVVAWPLGARE